ncbi:MAG: hypothetical protein IKX62_04290 [Bacteroidales bacterium]|nr:hypothetical protein [Bacteroidales bacterium]
MKEYFKSILYTLGALAVFSCAIDETIVPSPDEVPNGYTLQYFTANIETKTAYDDGHTVWSKGDGINIFWNNGHSITQAILVGEGGSTVGTFVGNVEDGAVFDCAIYPIDVEANVEGPSLTLPFRSDQEGTFRAANMAVSKVGEGNTLNFFNVSTLIAIQLTSDDITKIEVESVGGEALVGNLPVVLVDNDSDDGDEYVFGDIESGCSSVSMSAGEAGTYYISILPGITHSGGLLFKYYKGEEVYGIYHFDKELTTERNHILNFGDLESKLVAGKTELDVPVLRAESIMGVEFTVAWDAVPHAARYMCSLNDGAFAPVTGTFVKYEGLTPETSYSVKVYAEPAETTRIIYEDSPSASITVKTKRGPSDDDKDGDLSDFKEKPIF